MAEDKLIALILTAGSVVPFVVGALVVRQSLYAPEKGFFYVRGFRIERKDGPTKGKHIGSGIVRPHFWERARYYNLERELSDALDKVNQ